MPRPDLVLQTRKGRILAEVKAASEDLDHDLMLAEAQCERDEAAAPPAEIRLTSAAMVKWGALSI